MNALRRFTLWALGAPDREDLVLRRYASYRMRRLGQTLQQPLVRVLARAQWAFLLRLEREEYHAQHIRRMSSSFPEDWSRHDRRLYRARFVGWLASRLDVGFHPGRYEGTTSPLIAFWLDMHSEYAAESTGDTDWFGYYELHEGDFPWGDGLAYITSVNSVGFFDYTEFRNIDLARAQFAAIEADFDANSTDEGWYEEPFESMPLSTEGDQE